MLRMYNRTYKQSCEDVAEEFPNCVFLMRADAYFEQAGYLIAVSDSIESMDALCVLQLFGAKGKVTFLGGDYGEPESVGAHIAVVNSKEVIPC